MRGELFSSRREQDGGTEDALGWYLAGDYQLAKRWFVGARVEAAEHADDAAVNDTGAAAIADLLAERVLAASRRAAAAALRRAELRPTTTYTANEVLLQLQFAIGAHGAHPF